MIIEKYLNECIFQCITWMFHSKKLNNKINKMHEKCLHLVHNDNTSSYEELLKIDYYNIFLQGVLKETSGMKWVNQC